MEFKDCIEFANKTKDCAVATIEGKTPRVRMLGLWFADETGFYFQAWTFKGVYKQLKENPNIELCFHYKEKIGPYDMMRIRGEVEFLEDQSLKDKVFADRPFLKGLGANDSKDPRLCIFRLSHGEISLWPKKKEGEYPGLEIIKF